MIRLFKRRKRYIVAISSNNTIEFVEVKAKNKKEAMEMVTDVLMKCSIFPFISESEFELSCKKI